MKAATPFFKSFGPLLFGKPPVPFRKALGKLSACGSIAELRRLFGCYIPAAVLSPKASGANSRKRLFPLEVVFWSFLDQVQTPGGSCREAVRKLSAYLCRKFPKREIGAISPDTATYCKARARLPLEVIDEISEHLVERMEKHLSKHSLWHGRRVKLVDATGISMPDTEANQALWPQSSSQKPGCGFPSMNLVGLFCLHTGALITTASGERRIGETMLFQRLWHTLEKNDLVVADRIYCSFGTFARLKHQRVDLLMRLPENKMRKTICSQLPKADAFDVNIIWKRPTQRPSSISPEDFDLLPDGIPVRVIRYSLEHKGFRTKTVTLITTVTDPAITADELTALYLRRWEIELHFKELKITLNMDVLRCLSPAMIKRELRMHFVAYNLIRSVMQKAALTYHVDLQRISFKGTLDTVRHFSAASQGAEGKPRTITALVDEMLLIIARDVVPLRPDRSEPRAIKRRPKNFHLLTKPRHEMENLPHRNKGLASSPKVPLS